MPPKKPRTTAPPAAASTPAPPDQDTAAELEAAQLQSAAEGGATPDDTFDFLGATFRIADRVPEMAIMKFSAAAAAGLSSQSVEGRASMYHMLRSVIWKGEPCNCDADPAKGEWHTGKCTWTQGDWDRFELHCIETYADGNQMVELVGRVLEMIHARPTKRPSASRSTDGETSPSSRAAPPGADQLVPVADLIR
jgi:hypothetical protein